MEIVEGPEYLPEDSFGFFLWQAKASLQQVLVQDCAPLRVLEHDEDLGLVLVHSLQFDQVRVLAYFQYFYLTEDKLLVCLWKHIFLNNFNGYLFSSLQIAGFLNFAKTPLSQLFQELIVIVDVWMMQGQQ